MPLPLHHGLDDDGREFVGVFGELALERGAVGRVVDTRTWGANTWWANTSVQIECIPRPGRTRSSG